MPRGPDQVALLTREGCAFCAKAKKLLDEAGVVYADVPLPHTIRTRALGAIAKAGTVPQMFVNGKHVAVIGTGTAGMSAYRAAHAQGARTVVIEGGHYGTTCARVGCMPSKLLIAAADAAHMLDVAPGFGVHPGEKRIDGRAVMERVRRERDRLRRLRARKRRGVSRSRPDPRPSPFHRPAHPAHRRPS